MGQFLLRTQDRHPFERWLQRNHAQQRVGQRAADRTLGPGEAGAERGRSSFRGRSVAFVRREQGTVFALHAGKELRPLCVVPANTASAEITRSTACARQPFQVVSFPSPCRER